MSALANIRPEVVAELAAFLTQEGRAISIGRELTRPVYVVIVADSRNAVQGHGTSSDLRDAILLADAACDDGIKGRAPVGPDCMVSRDDGQTWQPYPGAL